MSGIRNIHPPETMLATFGWVKFINQSAVFTDIFVDLNVNSG